jgi:alkylhydroperoxidase family enzyme
MQQGMSDELYEHVHVYHDNPDFTVRERLAAEFAEQFAIDHRGIDDTMWERMSAHFSDVEMLELVVTCGFCVGMGRGFQVLDIARDFDVLWSREPEDQQNQEPA